jgi:DNA-binding transcriptional LysR family regulator
MLFILLYCLLQPSLMTDWYPSSLRIRSAIFTSHLGAALKAMAQDGRGIAWLPFSLVRDDLGNGSLVRAGDESWDTLLEIRLVCPHSLQRPTAERFWSLVVNHTG